MLFSSVSFLLFFLPIVLFLYGLIIHFAGRALSNVFLFIVSSFFYAWGEPQYILLLLLSILFNYLIARCIESLKRIKTLFLYLGVGLNLFILFLFKYLNFALDNLNIWGWNIQIPGGLSNLVMPIGISFYTFQALSYIIDVYRGEVKAQKSPLEVGLYIAFFPQLIAGPIVRYQTIELQIMKRTESLDKLSEGLGRFIVGLSKKVILSNNFALIADECFEVNGGGYLSYAWLGIIAYTLQIFYDFSGYSDMAIGLGKIFGFDFLENFNYPYFAKSISEFWRRWHISLGTFFREYVYIPLGGSRVNEAKIVRNLFIVWGLTGLWHGADWTFVLWGMMYFVLLMFEKFVFHSRDLGVKGHIYTMFFVMLGWVLFRSDTVIQAFKYIKTMLGIGVDGIYNIRSIVLIKENIFYLAIGITGCVPIMPYLKKTYKQYELVFEGIRCLVIPILFLICCCYLIKNTYNPFIYFNF